MPHYLADGVLHAANVSPAYVPVPAVKRAIAPKRAPMRVVERERAVATPRVHYVVLHGRATRSDDEHFDNGADGAVARLTKIGELPVVVARWLGQGRTNITIERAGGLAAW